MAAMAQHVQPLKKAWQPGRSGRVRTLIAHPKRVLPWRTSSYVCMVGIVKPASEASVENTTDNTIQPTC